MVAMLCIDNKKGVLFNHRRQSKDRVLQEHILSLVGTGTLWMSPYSKKQFTDVGSVNVIADKEYLNKAGDTDFCFVEGDDISPYIDKIDTLILFKWNRDYPADTYFTLNISNWTREETEDFAGYSHEKITKEIYRR